MPIWIDEGYAMLIWIGEDHTYMDCLRPCPFELLKMMLIWIIGDHAHMDY